MVGALQILQDEASNRQTAADHRDDADAHLHRPDVEHRHRDGTGTSSTQHNGDHGTTAPARTARPSRPTPAAAPRRHRTPPPTALEPGRDAAADASTAALLVVGGPPAPPAPPAARGSEKLRADSAPAPTGSDCRRRQNRHGSSTALVIPIRRSRWTTGSLKRSAGRPEITTGPRAQIATRCRPASMPRACVSFPGPEHRPASARLDAPTLAPSLDPVESARAPGSGLRRRRPPARSRR